MPSSAALWFIISTKAASEPATCSAKAVAQSLADTTATDLIISSMLICSPGSK